MKSFEELSREQAARESGLLSDLMGRDTGLKEIANFEADIGQQREEILFKITTNIEDTANALNQVEKLAEKLRRHLERLRKIQQTLAK